RRLDRHVLDRAGLPAQAAVDLVLPQVVLHDAGVPVGFVPQAPLAFLQALHDQVHHGRLDGFLDRELGGLVVGDAGLDLQQVLEVPDLGDARPHFIGENGLGGGYALQDVAGARVDGPQVHGDLIHAV